MERLRKLFWIVFIILIAQFPAEAKTTESINGTLLFTLDSATVQYILWQQTIPRDSVHGKIQNLTSDSVYFGFKQSSVAQWIIGTAIGGVGLQHKWPMDTIGIGPHETLPVLVRISPYPESPDTSSLCLSVISLTDSSSEEHCIPLYLSLPNVQVVLDSSSITYHLTPTPIVDTVNAHIQNISTDSQRFNFYFQFGTGKGMWTVSAEILGTHIALDSSKSLQIGPMESIPVKLLIQSSVDTPASAYVCFDVFLLPDSLLQDNCLMISPEASSDVSQSPSSSAALYPNPITTSAAIRISSEQAGRKPSIKIFDILGHDVTTMFGISESNNYIQLDRHVALSGFYRYELIYSISSAPVEPIGGTFIVQ